MPSAVLVPGPSLIYMGLGSGGSFLHVGFTEQNVRISNVPKHEGVQVDLSGGMDFDTQYMGEEVYASIRFSFYKEQVLLLAKQRLNSSLAPNPGAGGAGAIGSLMAAEGNCFSVAIVSQYYQKPVFQTAGMIAGYYFPLGYLADSDDRELGMKYKVEQVVVRSQPQFGLNGSYILYSNNVASLSLPNPS